MKITEIRKALKNAKIKLYTHRKPYGIFTTGVSIFYGEYDDCLIHLTCQANDHTYSTYKGRDIRCSYYAQDIGGFYAMQSIAKFALDSYSYKQDNPETVANFIKLISKRIDEKNYLYKYPDCQLSQLMQCLKDFGAIVTEEQIDGLDRYAFYKARRTIKNNELSIVNH